MEELTSEIFTLVLMVNGTENRGKNLVNENIDKKYYFSNHYDISINKYKIKCGTSSKFWENKGWINFIDPYGWLQWYFKYWVDRRSLNNERQIARSNDIVSRLKDKLVKMIKEVNCRIDHYSVSLKIGQVLLHWAYELVADDLS